MTPTNVTLAYRNSETNRYVGHYNRLDLETEQAQQRFPNLLICGENYSALLTRQAGRETGFHVIPTVKSLGLTDYAGTAEVARRVAALNQRIDSFADLSEPKASDEAVPTLYTLLGWDVREFTQRAKQAAITLKVLSPGPGDEAWPPMFCATDGVATMSEQDLAYKLTTLAHEAFKALAPKDTDGWKLADNPPPAEPSGECTVTIWRPEAAQTGTGRMEQVLHFASEQERSEYLFRDHWGDRVNDVVTAAIEQARSALGTGSRPDEHTAERVVRAMARELNVRMNVEHLQRGARLLVDRAHEVDKAGDLQVRDPRTLSKERTAIADEFFERYDFGEGVTVVGHDNWCTDDLQDLTKIAYVEYDDDKADPDAPSHKASFHVRFNEAGEVQEAYALEMEHGNEIGRPLLGFKAWMACMARDFGSDAKGVEPWKEDAWRRGLTPAQALLEGDQNAPHDDDDEDDEASQRPSPRG